MDTQSPKSSGSWVAVLPVAIIAFCVAGGISMVILGIVSALSSAGSFPNSPQSHEIFVRVLSVGIASVAGIYYGTRMAPSHRKFVAFSLALPIVAVSIYFLIINLMIPTAKDSVLMVYSAIAALVAAGGTVYYFQKRK